MLITICLQQVQKQNGFILLSLDENLLASFLNMSFLGVFVSLVTWKAWVEGWVALDPLVPHWFSSPACCAYFSSYKLTIKNIVYHSLVLILEMHSMILSLFFLVEVLVFLGASSFYYSPPEPRVLATPSDCTTLRSCVRALGLLLVCIGPP